MKKEYGWHWTNGDRLRDGRPVPPAGEWLVYEKQIKMCESGLHFSIRLMDALYYSPGTVLSRVEVEDVVERSYEKAVCRRRKILWSADMRWALAEFAASCALRAQNYANAANAAYAANAAAVTAAYAANAAYAATAANAAYATAANAAYANAANAANAAYANAAADAAKNDEVKWQESTLLLWAECMREK